MSADYPIIPLPGAESWERGYVWGEQLFQAFPDAEAEDFAYALAHNAHHAPDAIESGVVTLICEQVGENDERSWIWLATFGNGETWRIAGWCDYTGWDCQSGIECEQVTP